VVIVSLIGFWDWRSALLMGLAIPITLLITFGMAHALGIDLQQVSIATLIIAVISRDGHSNWLEGLQLIGVYVIVAVAAFFL